MTRRMKEQRGAVVHAMSMSYKNLTDASAFAHAVALFDAADAAGTLAKQAEVYERLLNLFAVSAAALARLIVTWGGVF